MNCSCKRAGYNDCVCPTKFDPTKPVQTRDGRKARILCIDANLLGWNNFPILSLIEHQGDKKELLAHHTVEGKNNVDGNLDLVNIRVKKWKWVYLAGNGEVRMTSDWQTREEAKQELAIRCMYHVIGHVMETEIEE